MTESVCNCVHACMYVCMLMALFLSVKRKCIEHDLSKSLSPCSFGFIIMTPRSSPSHIPCIQTQAVTGVVGSCAEMWQSQRWHFIIVLVNPSWKHTLSNKRVWKNVACVYVCVYSSIFVWENILIGGILIVSPLFSIHILYCCTVLVLMLC